MRSFGLGIRIFPGGPTPDASDQHSALKGPEATGSNVRLSQQCRPQNVDVHLIVLLWSHSQGDRWFAKWAPWPDSSGGSFGNVGKRCRSRLRILPSTSVAFINFTKWEILGPWPEHQRRALRLPSKRAPRRLAPGERHGGTLVPAEHRLLFKVNCFTGGSGPA